LRLIYTTIITRSHSSLREVAVSISWTVGDTILCSIRAPLLSRTKSNITYYPRVSMWTDICRNLLSSSDPFDKHSSYLINRLKKDTIHEKLKLHYRRSASFMCLSQNAAEAGEADETQKKSPDQKATSADEHVLYTLHCDTTFFTVHLSHSPSALHTLSPLRLIWLALENAAEQELKSLSSERERLANCVFCAAPGDAFEWQTARAFVFNVCWPRCKLDELRNLCCTTWNIDFL
jgi:hypothetical protein